MTLSEILENKIAVAYENKEYFFVKNYTDELYDNSMWMINKETKKVNYIDYTAFILDYMEKSTEINPSILKESL